jgi:N-acetylmuramoyl-L-alanine amidase
MKPVKIVVHCSDTPDDREVTAQKIHEEWHIGERGWDGIGYHAIVERSGFVENGRPWYWRGAHVAGHNKNSLGICLIGRSEFTHGQLQSARVWIRSRMRRFGIDKANVVGHYELDSGKTCPNIDMDWFRSTL